MLSYSENKGTGQLNGYHIFVFAYAKSRFSHDTAQISSVDNNFCMKVIDRLA